MAETFGVVAGAISFVSLIGQLHTGIRTLQEIRRHAKEAESQLKSLELEVGRLGRLIWQTDTMAPCSNDAVFQEHIQQCKESCNDVVQNLEKMQEKLESRLKNRLPKIFTFRHWKDDLEDLKSNVQRAREDLILTMICRISIQVTGPVLEPPLLTAPVSSSEERGSSNLISGESLPCTKLTKHYRPWNCETRHCSCSCHSTNRKGGRFWALEYTSFPGFRNICNNEFCSITKYGVGFKIALSQLGIRSSFNIRLYVAIGAGTFSLQPTLTTERLVPYTSPGFEILWKTENGLMTLEDAQNRLEALRKSDATFKNHVNPGGKSYIEELVRQPWPIGQRDAQCELLRLFMIEFKMTRGTENLSFLLTCATWIGEGPHLDWLHYLLQLGYDTTMVDSPTKQDWPEPCSPDWQAEARTSDPFFLEYIRLLCRDNQGFGMMSPLHEAVLSCSLEAVKKWTARSQTDERNFLGQTSLHLAVLNPHHLDYLIQSGHDVDAVDEYGITPLMYAAAMNQEESVMKLLEAGACPNKVDTRFRRTFVNYAAARGNWDLMVPILKKIRTLGGQKCSESYAKFVAMLSYAQYPDPLETRCFSLDQVLGMCGSVNFTFDDSKSQNNTLLHYARTVTDVDALIKHGFALINHENSIGQTPLFAIVGRYCTSDMIKRLLDAGADINHKDHSSCTALYYGLLRLRGSHGMDTYDTMNIALTLVARGADCLSRDNSRCSCSPGGCFPAAVLGHLTYHTWFKAKVPMWSLEWLSILLDQRGENEAKSTLLSFIRRVKHDEMDMTHVCRCSTQDEFSWRARDISDEDIDEIIDEESEFIDALECEMSQCSGETYETLLEAWIDGIKGSFDELCKEASDYNAKLEERNDTCQMNYTVDHKRDKFMSSIDMSMERRNPAEEVMYSIAQYVYWLECEYYSKKTCLLSTSLRDDWYLTRLPWVHRLISVLGVPVWQVAEKITSIAKALAKSGLETINHEEHIAHFLSSWAKFESAALNEPETIL